MPTRLAPLLLLFGLAAPMPARAVPITGYAFGHVVEDLSLGPGAPRVFTFGERVTLRYTYDLEPPDPVWGGRPSVLFEVLTAGGFSQRTGFASTSRVDSSGDELRVRASADPWSYDLQLFGGDGTLDFAVDLPVNAVGFRALVGRTDTFLPVTFIAPEPPTLLMGLVGAALASAWRLGT